jgi:CubicO group peptidase (beta-lactamase class C family)
MSQLTVKRHAMTIRHGLFVGALLLVPAIAGGCEATPAPSVEPSTSASAAVSADDIRGFAEYLRKLAAAGQFSGVALVAGNGQPVMAQAYGMADKERGVANTADTRFCIASMNKMFTAVAVAQLVEQGKLSFNDTIGEYVSGLPPEIADTVTIHHLLTHTSGMGDAALRRDPTTQTPDTLAGMLARIVREPLQFKPGSRFAYSNDGFIVLGAIIERVAGRSYTDYVREHVLKPAGMTDTGVGSYRPAEVPNMAHGYMRVDSNGQPLPAGAARDPDAPSGQLRDNADLLQVVNPSGGSYSTAADLLRFAQALNGHRLLGKALTDTILAGKVDSVRPGGPPVDRYAYGFSDAKVNGVRIVGHKGYTVVILTNQDRALVPALRRSQEMLTR